MSKLLAELRSFRVAAHLKTHRTTLGRERIDKFMGSMNRRSIRNPTEPLTQPLQFSERRNGTLRGMWHI
jgi:hypothetical protein